MNWTIEFKKIFLKELVKLPNDVRVRIEETVFWDKLIDNPFKILSLEKMSDTLINIKCDLGITESG